MAARDHHAALRSEVVTQVKAGYVEAVLAKLHWGKEDATFTLHVNPTGSTSGKLQLSDWLDYLGFQPNKNCHFSDRQQCWSKEVAEGYSVPDFATAFNDGFGRLQKADEDLRACGFLLPRNQNTRYKRAGLDGDGHAVISVEPKNKSEDGKFLYCLTFIKTRHESGYVAHYSPRHPPLSSEVESVFKYLGLQRFDQCPEFEFEACYYRTLRLFPLEAEKLLEVQATRFAPAVEALLAANAAAERAGLTFLPIANPKERLREDITRRIGFSTRPAPASTVVKTRDAALPSNFDVAISFAGSERELAEKLAEKLRAADIVVFYDNFYPEHLWGKNLTAFLDAIYGKSAKYCVVFVSREYKERKWTSHELRSAQARALDLKGQDYILPVKIDDTELEGLPSNVGYLSISLGIEKIADMLIKKLRAPVMAEQPVGLIKPISPLEMSVGTSIDFYEVVRDRPRLHSLMKRFGIKIENNDSSKTVSGIRISITAISTMASGYRFPWVLSDNLQISAGNQEIVSFAKYEEWREPEKQPKPVTSDTIEILVPNSDRHRLLGIEDEHTLQLRCTGTDVPPGDMTIKLSVVSGRLRIEKV